MAGYAFNMGEGRSPLMLDPGAEMQQAAAQAKQSKLARLLGTAANAGAGADYTQANLIDPAATQSFQKAQGGLQEDRFKSFSQKAAMAAAAWKSGNQPLAQGIYASLVPEAHAIAPGFDLPPQMDDSAAQAFEKMAQGAGGMVQSTFIDAQGNRVGIMRDGRTQVLGQNAPNNQIIDTGNGFYGVNRGNLSAAPVNIGGAAQQPPPPPPGGNEIEGIVANMRADAQKGGYVFGPEQEAAIRQQFASSGGRSFSVSNVPPAPPQGAQPAPQGPPMPQGGGGSTMTPPAPQGQPAQMPGQQLRSVPKPAAPSALDARIATAKAMGASDDDIKRMVLGSAANGGAGDDMAETIAQGIANGDQPPVTTGLYKYGAPVRAALEKRGFNLTKANQDYVATQKLYATMNGAQQVRLREAVGMVKESIPLVRSLAQEWNAGGFPALNKATLAAAKSGVLGPKAASLATRLDTQIADMTGEIGTVIMGGNSPTDHSLDLAAKQMSGNWSRQTFMDSLDQTEKNITYRENSIKNLGTSGIEESQYNQGNPSQQLGTGQQQAPSGKDFSHLWGGK